MPILWGLAMSKQAADRQAAAVLAGAAVPALAPRPLVRHVLPALQVLACDADPHVSWAAIAALAAVFDCQAGEAEVQDVLAGVVEDVSRQQGHAAELALLAALSPALATARQLEWLLRFVGCMLAAMHRSASGEAGWWGGACGGAQRCMGAPPQLLKGTPAVAPCRQDQAPAG